MYFYRWPCYVLLPTAGIFTNFPKTEYFIHSRGFLKYYATYFIHSYGSLKFHAAHLLYRDISNNPLNCDCRALWLLEWSLQQEVEAPPPPTCHLPSPLRDSPLTKIQPALLTCPGEWGLLFTSRVCLLVVLHHFYMEK